MYRPPLSMQPPSLAVCWRWTSTIASTERARSRPRTECGERSWGMALTINLSLVVVNAPALLVVILVTPTPPPHPPAPAWRAAASLTFTCTAGLAFHRCARTRGYPWCPRSVPGTGAPETCVGSTVSGPRCSTGEGLWLLLLWCGCGVMTE